jgi:hypothetical protein
MPTYVEKRGEWIYFDRELLPDVLAILPNGTIKDQGKFMVIEPLPQKIFKGEFDYIVIENEVVGWCAIAQHTNDRLLAVTGEYKTPDQVELLERKVIHYDAVNVFESILARDNEILPLASWRADRHWFDFDILLCE